MSISDPFLKRPIATSLLMLGILFFGCVAYRQLPIAALPSVDFPTINVSVQYPGASPDTMASSVATPLEQQFAAISGLDTMTSSSGVGTTSITLQFVLDRNIDGAAQDVQTAINAASGLLPTDLPNPPTYRKSNPADRPILIYALHSSVLPIWQVDDYAEVIIGQNLSTVSGVSQVIVAGAQKYAVRAQMNPRALAAHGIGLEDVRTALVATSINRPKGNLENAHQSTALDTNDQLLNAAAFRDVVIAYRNGAAVQLKDLGDAIDSVELNRVGAWYDNEPAILLLVQREAGANTIATAERVAGRMRALRASVPGNVAIDLISDRTQTIRASVADVQFTLLLSVSLVVGVIFVFLRKAVGDGDPRGGRAAVDHRHVRRHVSARLQPRQPVADGPDDRGRLPGRRCDRDDREHRPLHRGGRHAVRRRGQRRRADGVHHPVDHPVAGRRLHPAAADGRDRRTAVPRVRRHRDDGDPAVGRHRADADAGDVRAVPETRELGERGPGPWAEAGFDALLHGYDRGLRWVLRHQFPTLLFTVALMCCHGRALRRGSQGILPAAGHRLHLRRGGRSRGHLVQRHASADRAIARRDPAGPGGGFGRHIPRRHRRQCQRERRAHDDPIEAVRSARRQRRAGHRAAAARRGASLRHQVLHAGRDRISASAAACRARSINTH